MSSFRKRRDKWQVQIRIKGRVPVSKSFRLKSDALVWAREQERLAELGPLASGFDHNPDVTLGDLLLRYRNELVSQKACASFETYMVDALRRTSMARLKIGGLTPDALSAYRDQRLRVRGPDIVRRELGILHHAIEVARLEWGFPIPENPLKKVRKPAPGKPRDRRLVDGEEDKLLQGCQRSKNPVLKPIILFALETAMRRGEILNARWEDLNEEKRTLHISKTKNGHSRTIPLSTTALAIITTRDRTQSHLFPTTASATQQAWQRLTRRTEIEDLHFHDLRHEAISRLFERGLSVAEVALISGHRDVRQLFRYTHLRAEDIVKKLG